MLSFTLPGRTARAVLALAGAATALALGAAPARAATGEAVAAESCPTTAPELSQPFRWFGDTSNYALVPGGDMEDGLAGWSLEGDAAVADGNNWFRVADPSDSHSLRLEPGASALSAPICVDATYPSFRFFARKTRVNVGDLQVEVLWSESGATHSETISLHRWGGLLWAPVRALELPSEHLSTGGLEPVRFRFIATGHGGGAWLLDDLYVDPFSRG
jgi:hypothetical protein